MNRELTADLGAAFGNMGAGSGRDPFGGINFGGGSDPFGFLGGVGSAGPWDSLPKSLLRLDLNEEQFKEKYDKKAVTPATSPYTSSAVAVGGLGSSAYASKINAEAAKYKDAPELAEVVQAVMELESRGNPKAQGVVVTSGAYQGQRAQGLMQIMPGNYPNVNLMDVDTNIRFGTQMLYDRYKRYGNWDSAVASYLGAVDEQGKPTALADDNGTSGIAYAAIVNKNRAAIRQARTQQPTGAPSGTGLASIWGKAQSSVTQAYAVVSPGVDQQQYTYGQSYGLSGGHPGLDIGLQRGTPLYMPAGLTGVVEIAGGSGVFRDEGTNDPGNVQGRGELRVRLSNGDELIYGHNGAINVKQGQQVTGGQQVAAVGTHLHLEVRRRNADGSYTLVNPSVYFGNQQAEPVPGGNAAY